MKNLVFFVAVLVSTRLGQSSRILGVISTPSYSHQVWLYPFWKELSLRGHQVTVITTNPINDAALINLTEIDTSFSYSALTDNLQEIINSKSLFKMLDLTVKSMCNAFDRQLRHPQVKQLITDSNVRFDLVVSEVFVPASMAFAKRFNCPLVGVVLTEVPNHIYKMAGNPSHPILYPNMLLGEESNLNLKNRVLAVIHDLVVEIISKHLFKPKVEELIQKHFGARYNLDEIRQSVSLYLVNTDPIFNLVRSLVPTIIQVGGVPMRLPSKPLSKDLQTVLDKASGGFIYFSLGSNANSKDLSNKTMSVILETFKELPYTILWKYELDELLNKPDNVIISKWIPQSEVLKHGNLKLFITHGGIQSVQEGVYARVPMLGMAVFVDQPYNIKRLVNRGCALSVDYRTLEKDYFKTTILEMIHNPAYRNQIKKLADLAEDQPMTGLERAVWWTEYVLRHNGTRHLRSPELDIPWYQYFLLDVAGVFLLSFIIAIYVFVVVLRTIRKIFKCATGQNIKLKNQ